MASTILYYQTWSAGSGWSGEIAGPDLGPALGGPMTLDADPLWDPIRDDPRFLSQRQRAIDCHEQFMAERAG